MKLAVLGLTSLLAVQTQTAAPSGQPMLLVVSESVASLPVVHGPTWGGWDLPVLPSDAGSMTGLLVDDAGSVVARVDAELDEGVSTIHVLRAGTLDGDVVLAGAAAWPRFRVHGEWTAIAFTGQGWFDAVITVQASPGTAEFPIGGMRGQFGDDVSSATSVGRFAGRWRGLL